MTEHDARKWIDRIKKVQEDKEMVHSLEDDMIWEYVRGRAMLMDPVAKILMESKTLDFSRWCA